MVGGSSSISTLAPESIIRASMHRTRSPPESTRAFFSASSPENSTRPSQPRTVTSCLSSEYRRSQSISDRSTPSKYAALSAGNKPWTW